MHSSSRMGWSTYERLQPHSRGRAMGHDIVRLFDIGDRSLSSTARPRWCLYLGSGYLGKIPSKRFRAWSKRRKNDHGSMGDDRETLQRQHEEHSRPWDRSYGYDMKRYLSIMGLWIWNAVEHEASPIYKYPQVVAHEDDYEFAPLVSILDLI